LSAFGIPCPLLIKQESLCKPIFPSRLRDIPSCA
jgi:hypothetical protein